MKKFLVQISDSPTTRFHESDTRIAHELAKCAAAIAHVASTGDKPSITVTIDERPEAVIQPQLG